MHTGYEASSIAPNVIHASCPRSLEAAGIHVSTMIFSSLTSFQFRSFGSLHSLPMSGQCDLFDGFPCLKIDVGLFHSSLFTSRVFVAYAYNGALPKHSASSEFLGTLRKHWFTLHWEGWSWVSLGKTDPLLKHKKHLWKTYWTPSDCESFSVVDSETPFLLLRIDNIR